MVTHKGEDCFGGDVKRLGLLRGLAEDPPLGRMDAALVLRTIFQHAGRTWLQTGGHRKPVAPRARTRGDLRKAPQRRPVLVPAGEPAQQSLLGHRRTPARHHLTTCIRPDRNSHKQAR